ncbi:MAG: hypothetical protein EOP82_31210 [Variovorax sp.]|nr:MAG: hypothetical protein EOP82_31210 [Variovorax sp.]
MNARVLPEAIAGYGRVAPFTRVLPPPEWVVRAGQRIRPHVRGHEKLLDSLETAFVACGISDGATLSFHHHLRNGDQVLNRVLAIAAQRGLRGLKIAASSIFPVHAPLVEHIRAGVVTGLHTAYMAGTVAAAISRGALASPVIMTTHGGRARAIESGELRVDVAFVAAPAAAIRGNLSGAEGRAACGPLGYAMVDACHADRVVGVTDHLLLHPPEVVDIAQDRVDFIVEVESIGDPQGILSGTTRATQDALGLQIASSAAQVIAASGLLTGMTGALCLAACAALAQSDFPSKPIRLVIPYAAGGLSDGVVRAVAEELERTHSMKVIVDNRTGGNTVPAALAVTKATPDGYTLGWFSASTFTTVPALTPNLPYKTSEFQPVFMAYRGPIVMAVANNVPATNATEYIAYAKKQGERALVGATAKGGAGHLMAAALGQDAKVDVELVAYCGGPSMMLELLSGQLPAAMDILDTFLQQHQAKKLRIVGHNGHQALGHLAGRAHVCRGGLPERQGPVLARTVRPGRHAASRRESAERTFQCRDARACGYGAAGPRSRSHPTQASRVRSAHRTRQGVLGVHHR